MPSFVAVVDAVSPREMWQLAPGAMSLVATPARAQSLAVSAMVSGRAVLAPMSSAEANVWLCWVRLVTVRVRTTGPLAELTIPKSSCFGEKTTGRAVAPAGFARSEAVCMAALAA